MLKTIYVSYKATHDYQHLAHYIRSKLAVSALGCLPIGPKPK